MFNRIVACSFDTIDGVAMILLSQEICYRATTLNQEAIPQAIDFTALATMDTMLSVGFTATAPGMIDASNT